MVEVAQHYHIMGGRKDIPEPDLIDRIDDKEIAMQQYDQYIDQYTQTCDCIVCISSEEYIGPKPMDGVELVKGTYFYEGHIIDALALYSCQMVDCVD